MSGPGTTEDALEATQVRCPSCGSLASPADLRCRQCGGALDRAGVEAAAPPGPAEQPIIDERYRILGKLGDGGMGSVYKVEHVRMGKIMALKVLRPDAARNKGSVVRFRREAQTVSRLTHPNTITVFDCGETRAGLLYIAMEYVPGKDLNEILRLEGRLDERLALDLTTQVLRSLGEAHEAGIVHRDIKPGNVMLTRTREEVNLVKVLDFGIAKLAELPKDGGKITGGADMVGTPSCMSPEQIRGAELDRRSDLYSVTAMLFELLTGRGPFIGAPLEVVSQHLTREPPSLREACPEGRFSPGVEAIVSRGLAKDPARRFQSAEEMRLAIERVLAAALSTISLDAESKIARREDWEEFERSFKLQHYGERVLGVLAVAALAAGVYFGATRLEADRRSGPLYEEVEPNDQASRATPLTPGVPMAGVIGKRNGHLSDQDLYAFAVLESSVLEVSASAVPNVNLVLELFREPPPGVEAAELVAAVDDGPTSLPEALGDVPLGPGRYLLRLSDRRRLDEPDGVPRENSTDAYRLEVTLLPPRELQEREPDNQPSEAMELGVEQPVLGKGGAAAAVEITRAGPEPLPAWSIDQYRVRGEGPFCAVLGGVYGTSLRLSAVVPSSDVGGARVLRSERVRPARVEGLCARETSLFEVRVDAGSSGGELYPLAFLSERPGGLEGVRRLRRALLAEGRLSEARLLGERALELVPRAAEAAQLRAELDHER